MAVKYHCRKCGKRFVDWGAEKLGYKCPDCENEELVRAGSPDDKVVKRPSLKRKPRRISIPVPVDEEALGVDEVEAEPIESAELYPEEEELEEEAEFPEETAAVVEDEAEDEVAATDVFEPISPTIEEGGEDIIATDDEWSA